MSDSVDIGNKGQFRVKIAQSKAHDKGDCAQILSHNYLLTEG